VWCLLSDEKEETSGQGTETRKTQGCLEDVSRTGPEVSGCTQSRSDSKFRELRDSKRRLETMTGYHPNREVLESLTIADLKVGDRILTVEFRCECGKPLDILAPKEGGIDRGEICNSCEKQCGRCGEYSIFSCLLTASAKEAEFSKRKSNQDLLCEILSGNLECLSETTRTSIETLLADARKNEDHLLTGPSFDLRFRVMRIKTGE
jgi:hypothetical protein